MGNTFTRPNQNATRQRAVDEESQNRKTQGSGEVKWEQCEISANRAIADCVDIMETTDASEKSKLPAILGTLLHILTANARFTAAKSEKLEMRITELEEMARNLIVADTSKTETLGAVINFAKSAHGENFEAVLSANASPDITDVLTSSGDEMEQDPDEFAPNKTRTLVTYVHSVCKEADVNRKSLRPASVVDAARAFTQDAKMGDMRRGEHLSDADFSTTEAAAITTEIATRLMAVELLQHRGVGELAESLKKPLKPVVAKVEKVEEVEPVKTQNFFKRPTGENGENQE